MSSPIRLALSCAVRVVDFKAFFSFFSCAKRPVSAADIERLVGQVENALLKIGKPEVSSRVIGDKVIAGLKELDQIAYMRYAIVYLGLDDLHALRAEIDRLV